MGALRIAWIAARMRVLSLLLVGIAGGDLYHPRVMSIPINTSAWAVLPSKPVPAPARSTSVARAEPSAPSRCSRVQLYIEC